MPQEQCNRLRRLLEHRVGNAFLPRAQAENTQVVEPLGNRIAHLVRDVTAGGEIDLKPSSLALDAWTHGIAEHLDCQLRNEVRKIAILGRVLNGVARQSAAVSDQVAE